MTPAAGQSLFEVNVERRVAAPVETVFKYFTDPERYRQWQGVDAELDPRPGGTFRVHMTGRSGMVTAGVFLVVDPPNHVSFTWGWEPNDALPGGDIDVAVGRSRVDVSLEPDGDETVVRIRHVGLPSHRAHQFHDAGWNMSLDRLALVVSGGAEDNPFAVL